MSLIGIVAMCAVIILATAQSALLSTFDSADFPDALAVKLEVWPLVFPLHMFTGGLALLLVPLAFSLRGTRWHKWAGRAAAFDVMLAAITSIPVALAHPVTPWAAAGFGMQGLLWMLFLALGIRHIRQGRVGDHQHMMLLMAALTSGALFFRIFLYFWKESGTDIPFQTFYSLNAWIAWALPLLAMQAYVHQKKRHKQVRSVASRRGASTSGRFSNRAVNKPRNTTAEKPRPLRPD
jgi:hypothetical protein